MRSSLVRIAAVATLALLVAGCTNNTTNGSTPSTSTPTSSTSGGTTSTTPGTTPVSSTPTTTTNAPPLPPSTDITLDTLTVNMASVEAFDALTASAHVTNHAAKIEEATVWFWLDNDVANQAKAGARLGGNIAANVTFTWNTDKPGDHVVHAKLDNTERTTNAHIRAPTFTGFALKLDPANPCNAVHFNGTFQNTGDGYANGTTLTVDVMDNAQAAAHATGSLLTIQPGSSPAIVAIDAAFHTACSGVAPKAYTVTAHLAWHGVERANSTSTFNI